MRVGKCEADNNKLLGVSVSGSSISVGAVIYSPTCGSSYNKSNVDVTGNYTTPNTFYNQSITLGCNSIVSFNYQAILKTSSYTGKLRLNIDNVDVSDTDTDMTTFIEITGIHSMNLSAGSHTVKLILTTDNAGATATIKAWNTFGFSYIAIPTYS